jgi:2,4-diketo-3-deoxy-L-fuconate hydrolase
VRIINIGGRLALELAGGSIDVAEASGGEFGPDIQAVYERWSEFVAWATGQTEPTGPTPAPGGLGSPVPLPRQTFAVGLNYKDHADETGSTYPESPLVFTKFASAIAPPVGELVLPSESVDWEVELVVVIGMGGSDISEDAAWQLVAGLTLGLVYSERVVQKAGTPPQFSMGKSFPGFAPLGPCLVTLDEFDDVDNVALECRVNGEVMQSGRSSQLLFSVPQLIAWLSSICPLLPGDIIFTGTPAGVGAGMKPPRFLKPGDVVVGSAEGIGSLEQRCVAR